MTTSAIDLEYDEAEDMRVRRERVRRIARIARLEFQCQMLRERAAESMAAIRTRVRGADRRLTIDLGRWIAALRVLEARIARETVALDAQCRGS